MTDQTTAPQPTGRRRVSPITVTVVLVVALILVFLGVAGVITELLWHDQLGYLSVFLTQWI
ncbi:MAG: COG1615 family transporter, partial [Leucobacter sp.]|nr:COG1615 family transporter [Leucobacter sp.]